MCCTIWRNNPVGVPKCLVPVVQHRVFGMHGLHWSPSTKGPITNSIGTPIPHDDLFETHTYLLVGVGNLSPEMVWLPTGTGRTGIVAGQRNRISSSWIWSFHFDKLMVEYGWSPPEVPCRIGYAEEQGALTQSFLVLCARFGGRASSNRKDHRSASAFRASMGILWALHETTAHC